MAREVKEGVLVNEKEFTISAVKLNHSALCYGYIFEAKGKQGEFQRALALKHKIPEGPLWGELQQGKKVKVNGKTVAPEQVMDYSKGKKGAKVGLVFDTFPHAHYIAALKDCDAIVHESTAVYGEVCLTFDKIPEKWKIEKVNGNYRLCTPIKQIIGEPLKLASSATSALIGSSGPGFNDW